ncbi:protein of unknown function [Taphrina deformans PYCC 5710]|uniref:Protein kinase domain-containing protein n=1 Tax=Taphrina deformans (strain PYCC 5710 / ATCC 11124 / CBS 356.35 / IMI 108563 / JCM 9778 / NBRC 8474) TaxID=1097556 RepID=R4XD44_TAPDE|nr:protein of unknown function [Taphrina deformans PYCC 5710]|eukprot:CCG83740.1 protein of unknown function [Taphrina deformans PYCC 5710]
MSGNIHNLTPLKTRRTIPYDSDDGPRTPDLSSSDSTAPSSAFSRSSRQPSWNFEVEDSMEAPMSVKVLKQSQALLDVHEVLNQLQLSESPRTSSRTDKFTELVGRGTHADVYRASLAGFEVAAKIPNSKASVPFIQRERAVLDFICQATEDLDHIIEHFHGPDSSNQTTLFMELGHYDILGYLEAEQSRDKMPSSGPVVGSRAWHEIATSIVHGVAALHAIGMVHTDIKPQNILWTGEGVPKLIDFEGAFTPDGSMTRLKQRGYDVVGTTIYNAPELLRMGNTTPSFATDLYALGVTLLVLATGREPYAQARNGMEQVIQCQAGDPIRYASPRSRISPEVEKIVRGCCAKSPSDRWSITELLSALGDVQSVMTS